jgi:putative FmdB family regulatory protein
MPIYDYLCNDCDCEFEQSHGFGKTPQPCKCGSSDIEIVMNQAPMAFVKGEPKTLGQLAESNTKNMGHYELDDYRAKQEKGNLKKQKPKEWWKKSGSATKSEINNMSKAQKAAYIKKGKE